MPKFTIDTPVVVFNHEYYGSRILFHGPANTRNELGKIGVTLHSDISSGFYRTITIQAPVRTKDGVQAAQEFKINRSSLMKYLGEKNNNISDDNLIAQLKSKLYHDQLTDEDIKRQSEAGEGLRYAGQYNKTSIRYSFKDSILGSFLSWLYQTTIVSLNWFKARFIFVRTEEDLFKAGETLTKARYHEAHVGVPAYSKHTLNVDENSILSSVPTFRYPKNIKCSLY